VQSVEPDHVAAAIDLGELLARIVAAGAGEARPCPESLVLEVEIAAGKRLGAEKLASIADPSAITCPDCNGVLSEVRGEQPLRYRCQIGHALTAEVVAARAEQVDEALRIALRVMEERVTLVTRMAEDARSTGRRTVAELYESRAEEYSGYASVLRAAAVASLRDNKPTGEGG
jgi:two-component system, chemotaxis family, protein-glutamate methylesterase/glutaminase